jgi:hypothetical protein
MDAVVNAIVVKIQKQMNCETNASDAQLLRVITRNLLKCAYTEKKVVLMTFTFQQIIEKYGKE